MEKREEYLKRAERDLAELTTKLEGLRRDALKLTDDARARLGQTIDRASERQGAFKVRLEQLREMSSDAWADLREGLAKASADLKEAVDHAVGEFQKTSGPRHAEGEQPTIESMPKQTTTR